MDSRKTVPSLLSLSARRVGRLEKRHKWALEKRLAHVRCLLDVLELHTPVPTELRHRKGHLLPLSVLCTHALFSQQEEFAARTTSFSLEIPLACGRAIVREYSAQDEKLFWRLIEHLAQSTVLEPGEVWRYTKYSLRFRPTPRGPIIRRDSNAYRECYTRKGGTRFKMMRTAYSEVRESLLPSLHLCRDELASPMTCSAEGHFTVHVPLY